MLQCATASSDALHLTLLLAVRYSSGCQAHLDAQRTLHIIEQMSTAFQLCIADSRCHSPAIAVVKQSLPASSSRKASQSSALSSSMACRKVISSTWPPASRSISPLLLALTCAGLKEDILAVPSKVKITSGSSLIGQAVNSEKLPSTTRRGVPEPLVVNHRYTAYRNADRAEHRRKSQLQLPTERGARRTKFMQTMTWTMTILDNWSFLGAVTASEASDCLVHLFWWQ